MFQPFAYYGDIELASAVRRRQPAWPTGTKSFVRLILRSAVHRPSWHVRGVHVQLPALSRPMLYHTGARCTFTPALWKC